MQVDLLDRTGWLIGYGLAVFNYRQLLGLTQFSALRLVSLSHRVVRTPKWQWAPSSQTPVQVNLLLASMSG